MNLNNIFSEIHENLIQSFNVELNKKLNSDTVYSNNVVFKFNELWIDLKRFDIQNAQIQIHIMQNFVPSKLNNNPQPSKKNNLS